MARRREEERWAVERPRRIKGAIDITILGQVGLVESQSVAAALEMGAVSVGQ